MTNSKQAIIGLMAGTSVDGVDAALVWTDGHRLERSPYAGTFDYHPKTKEEIFKAFDQPSAFHPELENWIARDHAHAVERIMVASGIVPDMIGFHGQTIFHDPDQRISLQIGDGQYIADRIGVPVVYQFRQNDLDHGGQGAPLAPIYHHMILRDLGFETAALVNIGGISNITIVDGDRLIGFDAGPGNALIDDAAMRLLGHPMDHHGETAGKGQANQAFVDHVLGHEYFHQKGAKSLDRVALYDWLDLDRINTLSSQDQLASLTALTAAGIAAGIKANLGDEKPCPIIVTGGGSFNPVLMDYIRHYIKSDVSRLDDYQIAGVNLDSRFTEAELMALLTARHCRDLPISFPETTGVKAPSSGGVMLRPRLK